MNTSVTRRCIRFWPAAPAAIIALALAVGFPGWAQDADQTGETSAALPAASDSAPKASPSGNITPKADAPTQGSQTDGQESSEPAAQATPEKSPPPAVPEAELVAFGYAFFSRAPSTYAPIADTPVPPNYSLGPGDTLRVSFWSTIGQATTVTRPIDASGRIDLPLLGTVTARGMTLAQFEAMVLREYRRHFHQIQGRVTLDHIRSLQVMVAGDAARPGLYTISALSTAFNAIYQAGGPTPRGSMRRIALIRNGEQIATIDLYDYLLTGRRVQDYTLESGDTLFVPVVGAVVGIKGWVKRPALYELVGGERLRDLIEMAGGVRAATYLKLVQIERIRAHTERILVDVDVSALLGGDETDNLELRDGDSITVGTVLDRRTNSVEIIGRVARAGFYELKPGMRIKDLVAEAQGTLGEVDMGRAEILRTEPDQTTRIIPFDLGKALAGDPEANLSLQPWDKVTIYSPDQIQRRRKVSIGGRVQRPGTYDRLAGMRLADLIYAAGGLLDDAYPDRANLARVLPDGSRRTVAIDLGRLQAGDESQNPLLQDRDVLTVYSRADVLTAYSRADARWIDRSVAISGAVRKPGAFERTEGMRLKDLLFLGGGVLPDAFLDRADLLRVRPDQTVETIPIDLGQLDDPRQNLQLRDRDRLRVFHRTEVQWRSRAVSISGAVQRPGTYERTRGMTLRDLIFQAGNLLPNAAGKAEIGRTHGTRDTNILVVDLDRLLEQGDLSVDMVLQDGDKALVPEVGNYLLTPETVTLGGEVKYPGVYALQGKHERLSHLIERAGGLTEYAFPEGAIFTRRTDQMITPPQADVAARVQEKALERAERRYQLELARAARAQPRAAMTMTPGDEAPGVVAPAPIVVAPPKAEPSIIPSGRIPVDLKTVLADPGSLDDLVLEEGDALTIPKRPTTVVVAGAVVSPGAITYRPGGPIDYYVSQCGGYDEDASSGRTVVLRANGTVLQRRHVRSIELGDVVIVPPRAIVVSDESKWDRLGKALAATANLATAFFLIREAAR